MSDAPSRRRQLFAIRHAGDYDLQDMARDAVEPLGVLGIPREDLVGMSLGGLIAQIVSAEHPDRVRTLTSVFSTTGDPTAPAI